jgi:hypothetical protein
MYCMCVNVYCHRVTTQYQLVNISNKILHVIFHENSLDQYKENSGYIFATFRTKLVKNNLLEMDL